MRDKKILIDLIKKIILFGHYDKGQTFGHYDKYARYLWAVKWR